MFAFFTKKQQNITKAKCFEMHLNAHQKDRIFILLFALIFIFVWQNLINEIGHQIHK